MKDDEIKISIGLYMNLDSLSEYTLEKMRARYPNAEKLTEVIIEWGSARREMTFAEFKRCIFGDSDAG